MVIDIEQFVKKCECDRNKKKMLITVAYVQTLKTKCSKCGYNKDKSALEFHHVDDSNKSFNIGSFACSRIWSKKTKQLIDAEVNKFNSIKKNYISDLKSIRFFEHKYIKK